MPRIAKGGKYVFGWSLVGESGRIVLPPEAVEEYGFHAGDKVILMSGSRTSGGFGVSLPALLKKTRIFSTLPTELVRFRAPRGEILRGGRRALCWTTIKSDGSITVPLETLRAYGTEPGARLLSVRGSYLALGFLARGPLVGIAMRYSGLHTFG